MVLCQNAWHSPVLQLLVSLVLFSLLQVHSEVLRLAKCRVAFDDLKHRDASEALGHAVVRLPNLLGAGESAMIHTADVSVAIFLLFTLGERRRRQSRRWVAGRRRTLVKLDERHRLRQENLLHRRRRISRCAHHLDNGLAQFYTFPSEEGAGNICRPNTNNGGEHGAFQRTKSGFPLRDLPCRARPRKYIQTRRPTYCNATAAEDALFSPERKNSVENPEGKQLHNVRLLHEFVDHSGNTRRLTGTWYPETEV